MTNINIPIAFGAGVISFFAPCIVPLLPAYIGYVTGISVKELKDNGYSLYRKRIITTSLLYILGFSIVFVLLGSVAAGVGVVLRRYSFLIQRVGGLIILILGLEFAGILNFSVLAKPRSFKLPGWTERLGDFRALFVGFIFATAWTPCIGAILGSILALAATTGKAVEGAVLLFFYSLGISIPFLIVSMTLASAPRYLKVIKKRIDLLARVAGILLAILGLMLLTDTYKYINSFIYSLSYDLGWTEFLLNTI